MSDTLRSAIEALAKEWGEADDTYHNPTVQQHEAARRLRAILATHPEEPLREALREISKRLHYSDIKSDSGPVEIYGYMMDLARLADVALSRPAREGD